MSYQPRRRSLLPLLLALGAALGCARGPRPAAAPAPCGCDATQAAPHRPSGRTLITR